MSRARVATAVVLALFALALAFGACGGDDDATTEAPGGSATPPSAGALPPQLLQCFADEGFEIASPSEIHSAPQAVVQKCFTSLHQGGTP